MAAAAGAQIIELGIKLATPQLDEAANSFDKTSQAAQRTQQEIDAVGGASEKMENRIQSSIDRLAIMAATFVSLDKIKEFINNVEEVGSATENMEARLTTVTGSVEAAKQAFGDLNEWADKTPFSIASVVDAFTKLRISGIAPTEGVMNAIGNIAATTGTSFNDMASVVAAAVNGQYRGLQQFGIKVTEVNGKLVASFQGHSTILKNNGTDLINYLQKLGNTQFANGIANQMNTLSGSQAALTSATEGFYRKIAEGGFDTALVNLNKYLIQITGNSDALAKSIGSTLGGAINGAVAIMKDFSKQSDYIKVTLEAMGIMAAINLFIALADILGVAKIAMTALNIVTNANPYVMLGAAIIALISYAGGLSKAWIDLQASFVLALTEIQKGTNDLAADLQKGMEIFSEFFTYVKNLAVAFASDLTNIITHPFQAANFSATTAAWAAPMLANFKLASQAIDGQNAVNNAQLNAQADAEINNLMTKWNKVDAQQKASAAKTDAPGSINRDAGTNSVAGSGTGAQDYSNIVDKAIGKLQEQYSLLTLSADAQERLKAETDVENQLREKGLTLKSQDKARIDQIIDATIQLRKETQEVDDFFKDMADATTQTLLNIFKGGNSGLKDMLKTWTSQFESWVAKTVEEELFQPLFDSLGTGIKQVLATENSSGGGSGGSLLGTLASWVGSLFHFADGGGGVVGGVGGTDSQTVSFKATPGENVLIKRPNDTSSGGGSVQPVQVNVINNANDTKTSQSSSNNGQTIDVMIDSIVAQKMSQPSSNTHQAMKNTFGINRTLAGR